MIHKLTILIMIFLFACINARAISSKTFVAPTKGDDQSPCTQNKPCKTIAAAMRNTKDGGTVILLEAREENGKCAVVYDRVVTISKSLTIKAARDLKTKPCFVPGAPEDRAFNVEGANIRVRLQSLKIAQA